MNLDSLTRIFIEIFIIKKKKTKQIFNDNIETSKSLNSYYKKTRAYIFYHHKTNKYCITLLQSFIKVVYIVHELMSNYNDSKDQKSPEGQFCTVRNLLWKFPCSSIRTIILHLIQEVSNHQYYHKFYKHNKKKCIHQITTVENTQIVRKVKKKIEKFLPSRDNELKNPKL